MIRGILISTLLLAAALSLNSLASGEKMGVVSDSAPAQASKQISIAEARAALQDGDAQLALSIVQRALTAKLPTLQISVEDMEDTVILHRIAIDAADHLGDNELRQRSLQDALNLLRVFFDEGSAEVQSWNRELVTTLVRAGKVHDAEQILIDARAVTLPTLEFLANEFQLAQIYENAGMYAQAKEQYLSVSRSARTRGNSVYESVATHYAAFSAIAEGEFEEAEQLHVRVVQQVNAKLSEKDRTSRVTLQEREVELISSQQLARLRIDQGRYDEAARILIMAISTADVVFGSTMHHVPFSLRNTQAEAIIFDGDYQAGKSMIERHLSYARSGEVVDSSDLAQAHALLGFSISNNEALSEEDARIAEDLLRDAFNTQRNRYGERNLLTLQARVFLASHLQRMAMPELAMELLHPLATWLHDGSLTHVVGIFPVIRIALATLFELENHSNSLYPTASGLLKEWQSRHAELDLLARNYSHVSRDRGRGWIPGLFLDSAWESRATTEVDKDLLLSAIQDASIDATSFSIAQGIARKQATEGATGNVSTIKEREVLLAEYRQLSDRILERANASWLPGADTQGEREQLRLEELDIQLNELDSKIAELFPSYSKTAVISKYDLQAIRNSLKEAESIVALFPTQRGTHIAVIDKSNPNLIWHRAPLTDADITRLVARLRQDLDLSSELGQPNSDGPTIRLVGEFDVKSAHELYTQLLQPIQSHLGTQKTVHFLTIGPLASLPLAVLVKEMPGPSGDADFAGASTKWVLDDPYAISYIPSISSFVQQEFEKGVSLAEVSGLTLFGIADPTIVNTEPVNEQLESPSITQLDKLVGTREFLKSVSEHFEHRANSLLYGVDANQANILANPALRTADVLVFATHGLTIDEALGILEPSLLLSDSGSNDSNDALLTASEIAALELNASLIVLAACNTAAGDELNAGSLNGLARAFFQAGGKAVLASHWTVSETATNYLMEKTIEKYASGLNLAHALKQAMMETRNAGVMSINSALMHPSMWAPFVPVTVD